MPAAQLAEQGWARLCSGMPRAELDALPLPETLADDAAGSRNLLGHAWCRALVEPLRARLRDAGVPIAGLVAIQCTFFRKTADCNWKVPYHQDLSVPVAERIAHPALSGWSTKEDGCYVQPPAGVLSRSLAVRLHLDPCGEAEGPLRVIPGSHRAGRIDADAVSAHRAGCAEVACTADIGDLLLMRPLLLHASSKATTPAGRRVLHFLFAPERPGYGLRWRTRV